MQFVPIHKPENVARVADYLVCHWDIGELSDRLYPYLFDEMLKDEKLFDEMFQKMQKMIWE